MTEFIPDLYAATCVAAAVAYVVWVFAGRRKASLAKLEVSVETQPRAFVGDARGHVGDLHTGVAERDTYSARGQLSTVTIHMLDVDGPGVHSAIKGDAKT